MLGRYRIDSNKTTQFTEAWVLLALIVTLGGLWARRPAVVLAAALLLTIVPIAWLWNRLALSGVLYARTFSERRAFVGETVTLRTLVTNRKLLPVGWLQISDDLPVELTVLDADYMSEQKPGRLTLIATYSLRWYERVERVYRVVCSQRGYYTFGPASMKAGDIFGLFDNRRSVEARDTLIIYPRVLPLEALGLPAKDPLGDRSIRRRVLEDPNRTIGVRDYQAGDELRRIHWKATARRQSLQSRIYEPTTAYNVIVFLNVANFERFWHGYDPILLEKTVSAAASIASFAAERRYAVGLVANGCLPESDQPIKVLPGRSPGQLTRILEMLAAVTPVASAPIEDLLISESSSLPWGSTIVLVTGIVTADIAGSLQRLHAAGRHVVLISLAEPAPPQLDGILVYHAPRLRDADDDAAALSAGLSEALSEPPHAEEAVCSAG